MQINFTPEKIKAAKVYVNKLSPIDNAKNQKKKRYSIKNILNFLFK